MLGLEKNKRERGREGEAFFTQTCLGFLIEFHTALLLPKQLGDAKASNDRFTMQPKLLIG